MWVLKKTKINHNWQIKVLSVINFVLTKIKSERSITSFKNSIYKGDILCLKD